MAKLQPLAKEITDEIRLILEGCRDGRLKHDQTSFHCGTKHCIAGWKEMLDYRKAANRPTAQIAGKKFSEWMNRNPGSLTIPRWLAWGYAQRTWDLTNTEANILFDSDATFDDQFALLEKLERGKRER